MTTSCPVKISAAHAAAAPERMLAEDHSKSDALMSKERRLKERRKETNAGKFGDGRVNLIHVQIVTSLMRGTKSRKDLVRETGANLRTVSDFVKLMHDQGAVYLADIKSQDGANRPSELYALQRVPFECADVEREM